MILLNENIRIGILSLSTADVTVLLRANTMRVTARLGSLDLVDDSDLPVSSEFKQILSIEGDDFADFSYQTFDPAETETYSGIKSKVHLSAGSIKVIFLEQPLHDIYLFATKLAKLKGVYDAATQAAVQKASEIEKMQFDIVVKTPIIVLPSDPTQSSDKLTLRLGEFGARNAYDSLANKITASLRGIQLASEFEKDHSVSKLKIIDDIDVSADVVQTSGLDRSKESAHPDMQVTHTVLSNQTSVLKFWLQISVNITDVKLHLTQAQYIVLLGLSRSIPRVLEGAPEGVAQAEEASSFETPQPSSVVKSTADLQPELRITSSTEGATSWTTLDLGQFAIWVQNILLKPSTTAINLGALKLHIYDEFCTEANISEHGIARFALNNNSLRMKMVSDNSYEAQVVIKSFTMSNTRKGNSKFREIIPAAQHDRNQVMALYTVSSGPEPSALAIVTVDSPQIILAFDPLFAILNFLTSPFSSGDVSSAHPEVGQPVGEVKTLERQSQPAEQSSSFSFRFDLHDAVVNILENESILDSQAIHLTVRQLQVSQQVYSPPLLRRQLTDTRVGHPRPQCQ